MKINPAQQPNRINAYEQMKKMDKETKPVEQPKDKLDVSKNYEIYENAMRALKQTSDPERLEMLDRLKEQINKGEYKISSQQLADIIIDKATKGEKL